MDKIHSHIVIGEIRSIIEKALDLTLFSYFQFKGKHTHSLHGALSLLAINQRTTKKFPRVGCQRLATAA